MRWDKNKIDENYNLERTQKRLPLTTDYSYKYNSK